MAELIALLFRGAVWGIGTFLGKKVMERKPWKRGK